MPLFFLTTVSIIYFWKGYFILILIYLYIMCVLEFHIYSFYSIILRFDNGHTNRNQICQLLQSVPKKTPARFHVHLLHSGRHNFHTRSSKIIANWRGEWWEQPAFYETHLSPKLKCPERREFLYFLNTLNYCQKREFFLN